MSTTFRAGPSDTFETVARKVYGDERQARRIAQANPGVVEPIPPGTVLTTPPQPAAPANKRPRAPSDNQNEVALLIDGTRFRFWTDLSITRALDAMDTVEFSAPFEAGAPGFRETFRPFSFKDLDVTVGGTPLFTGTLIGVMPVLDAERKTIGVSGYSRPGVLEDCTAPASAYPVEFNGLDLQAIAAALCEPFGLGVVFDGPVGPPFERAAVEPGSTVLSFLSDLAKQRNLVVSSTPDGALLFQQSVEPGAPVAVLRQGASPVLGVTPSFSPQQYFSHITGLQAVRVGTEGSQFTVRNPHLAGVVRPMTFSAPDVEGGSIADAVQAKTGRMFGNMAAYGVPVSTWRDAQGALWAPNTTVLLEAPGAMVYAPYEFVVRSVRFDRSGAQESAELDLVLPGSFSGQTPGAMPWD